MFSFCVRNEILLLPSRNAFYDIQFANLYYTSSKHYPDTGLCKVLYMEDYFDISNTNLTKSIWHYSYEWQIVFEYLDILYIQMEYGVRILFTLLGLPYVNLHACCNDISYNVKSG